MYPLEYLRGLLGVRVSVGLRNGQDYTGVLKMFDEHINILLAKVEQGRPNELLFLRSDNILTIAE
ncbi:hypothetical protein NEHOM01_1640 [Nematocida homosporus]|uniref:uncharacterized protein n=1 Tax=Nematocida homosporus TaxID=1912981 RepID=UPI00221ED728|nr:uncharacterized protein NEHOM01_1640 [Nematocida homosporus]KAI5186701.1 hypothetical protein NEHOM01_1640 [Nematocida homosporus]